MLPASGGQERSRAPTDAEVPSPRQDSYSMIVGPHSVHGHPYLSITTDAGTRLIMEVPGPSPGRGARATIRAPTFLPNEKGRPLAEPPLPSMGASRRRAAPLSGGQWRPGVGQRKRAARCRTALPFTGASRHQRNWIPACAGMTPRAPSGALGHLSSTVPPASSICFLIFSASALLTPSLIGFGAPSTSALASPRPSWVIARTSLMTLIFLPPSPVRITSNSDFSSSAGAAAAAAGAAEATAAAAETPHFSSSALASSAASRTVSSESWSTSLVMSAIVYSCAGQFAPIVVR